MIKFLKKYLRYFSSSKKWIGISFLCAIIASGCNIMIPRYISMIANTIEEGMYTRPDSIALHQYGKISIFLIWCSIIFGFCREHIIAGLGQKMNLEIRTKMNDKIDKIQLSVLDRKSMGDIMNRCVQDVNSYAQTFSSKLNTIINCMIIVIGCIGVMLYMNWLLAIAAIVVLGLGIFCGSKLTKVSQRFFVKIGKTNAQISSFVKETLTGHIVVKAFSKEEKMKEKFLQQVNKQKKEALLSGWISGMLQLVIGLTNNMTYVVICILGIIMYLNDYPGMTMGVLVAFILYVKMIASPLNQLSLSITAIQPAFAAADRVFDFLDSIEIEDQGQCALDNVKGEVIFDHVCFGYSEDHEIIHDFNATIKPGMKVAIVGPTGAGKSTLVNLLMRYYELNSGCIRIDGVPTNEISRHRLHDILGMVLQETWTFEGTLRENIVYATQDVTEQELEDVLQKTGLKFMTDTLPDGLDSVISDNISFSAGQKQLITIARLMIKNPKILILDEATSSIDTRTEKLIQDSIDDLSKDRTSFVIAHRLSTIMNADLIFVMKDGAVVEMGRHDELLQRKGLYSELYYSQFDSE